MKTKGYGIPKSQIDEINNLLLAYSEGKYNTVGKISEQRDEIDSIILGVNMLGEELAATTISRDYFSNIYNSVGEMLFVLNEHGIIIDANQIAQNKLGISPTTFSKVNITAFFEEDEYSFSSIKKELNGQNSYLYESIFISAINKIKIHVSCNYVQIKEHNNSTNQFLLVATDISERKNNERQILKTVVETEENERARYSKDLHDSLGSDLSMLTLLLTALKPIEPTEKQLKVRYMNLLNSTIQSIRAICHNIMPPTLRDLGLYHTVNLMISNLNLQQKIKFKFICSKSLVISNQGIETALYRLIQEFINNSIKHSDAKYVQVELSNNPKHVALKITDDGCGFDYHNNKVKGSGLSSMKSRVNAYNGALMISSKIGQGTTLEVTIPYCET